MVVNDGVRRGAAWDALAGGGRNKQYVEKKNRASAERDRRRTAGL